MLFCKPDNIVWCYSCWQPLYKDLLLKFPFIKFIEGLPETFNDDDLLPPHKVNLIVVDDLMEAACDNNEIEKAFTKYVHHRNLSIITLYKIVFCQGKKKQNDNFKYKIHGSVKKSSR